MQSVQITPLVGLPQIQGWSHVAFSSDRSLVCAYAVSGANASNVGRDVADSIGMFVGTTAIDCHHFFLDLMREVHDKECELTFAVRLKLDDRQVVGVAGGHVLLKRGSKTGVLLSSEQAFSLIEGKTTPEDVVVLATVQASSFTGAITQKMSQGFGVDTIITDLVPQVHGAADSSLTALAFITAEPDEMSSLLSSFTQVELPPLQPIPPAPSLQVANQVDELAENEMSARAIPTISVAPVSSLEFPPVVSSQPLTPAQPARAVGLVAREWARRGGRWAKKVALLAVRASRELFSRDMYLHPPRSRSVAKKIVPVVVVIVVLAIAGGWWRSRSLAAVSATQQALAPLQERVSRAQATIGDQPVQARAAVAEVLQELEVLGQSQDSGLVKSLIEAEISTVRQLYDSISGKEEQPALPIFYDFRVVQSDFLPTLVDSAGQTGVFVDSGTKKAVVLNLQTKEQRLIDLASLESVTDITATERNVFMVGRSGLSRLGLTGDTAAIQALKASAEETNEAKFIALFGANAYVFNPVKRAIYRYPGTDTGFDDPTSWLRSSPGLTFEDITSFAIDSNIWMTSRQGEIFKYTTGRPQEFAPQGMTEPFASSLYLTTNENLTNLYVLEPNKQRLVILSKTGEFIREVKSSSLASGTSLIVSEELKKALVVNGSLVFEIAL